MIAVLAAVVAPLLAAAPTVASDPARAAIVTGIAGGDRDGGDIRFKSWEDGVGFVLTPDDDAQGRAIFDSLRDASEHSGSFTVRFTRGSGTLEAGKTLVRFRACAIEFETKTFTLHGSACGASPPGTGGRASLSIGVAAAVEGDGAAAIAPLTEALAEPALPREGRIVALRARRYAERTVADRASGMAKDRALVAALADARARADLDPDDADARLGEAADLGDLGAYEEAIAAYARIVERWPDEDYRASIRIGAIHRALGDNAKALAALDGLVERHGAQDGMRFHYHRGWTLTNLDRNEEAVSELTQGLAQQADYSWAYVRRACALGKLGRIGDALADQRRGRELFERWLTVQVKPDAETVRMHARARAVEAELAARLRTDPTGMTSLACEGYPDDEAKRSRSALLPAAS